jgi:hypothetical protein
VEMIFVYGGFSIAKFEQDFGLSMIWLIFDDSVDNGLFDNDL